ncbi:hypothetical protein ARAM_002876 [Aspergillus rambellii]|uniref:Uncharacterized protein n=1 Tax=Aspergillus rambellii TaxID=308745 RepID=A0A0F8U831_9EURO|nr:hypothetical protein ARAM_002876 [Aspergillus rambellii]
MTATACLGLEVWWKKRGREGLGRRARVQMPLFAWEGLLVVLWLVVFGVFGAVYLGARHRDKESSAGADAGAGADVLDEGIRLVRMRRAVRVDLVNVLLWAASATWSGLRWWRGKSAAAAAAANSGSDVAAGAGAGAGEEKEMV